MRLFSSYFFHILLFLFFQTAKLLHQNTHHQFSSLWAQEMKTALHEKKMEKKTIHISFGPSHLHYRSPLQKDSSTLASNIPQKTIHTPSKNSLITANATAHEHEKISFTQESNIGLTGHLSILLQQTPIHFYINPSSKFLKKKQKFHSKCNFAEHKKDSAKELFFPQNKKYWIIHIPKFAIKNLTVFWPKKIAASTLSWIHQNIFGDLKDIHFYFQWAQSNTKEKHAKNLHTYNQEQPKKKSWHLESLTGNFFLDDMAVLYKKSMPIVEKIQGEGFIGPFFRNIHMSITQGSFKNHHLHDKSTLYFSQLHTNPQLSITLPIESFSLKNTLFLLQNNLKVLPKNLPLDMKNIQGKAKGLLKLQFPFQNLIKNLTFSFVGHTENIVVPVQNYPFTLRTTQGDVVVDNKQFSFQGQGSINDMPGILSWKQDFKHFEKTSGNFSGHLSLQQLEKGLFIPDFRPHAQGNLFLSCQVNPYQQNIAITIDGKNLCCDIPFLNYHKKKGDALAGTATFQFGRKDPLLQVQLKKKHVNHEVQGLWKNDKLSLLSLNSHVHKKSLQGLWDIQKNHLWLQGSGLVFVPPLQKNKKNPYVSTSFVATKKNIEHPPQSLQDFLKNKSANSTSCTLKKVSPVIKKQAKRSLRSYIPSFLFGKTFHIVLNNSKFFGGVLEKFHGHCQFSDKNSKDFPISHAKIYAITHKDQTKKSLKKKKKSFSSSLWKKITAWAKQPIDSSTTKNADKKNLFHDDPLIQQAFLCSFPKPCRLMDLPQQHYRLDEKPFLDFKKEVKKTLPACFVQYPKKLERLVSSVTITPQKIRAHTKNLGKFLKLFYLDPDIKGGDFLFQANIDQGVISQGKITLKKFHIRSKPILKFLSLLSPKLIFSLFEKGIAFDLLRVKFFYENPFLNFKNFHMSGMSIGLNGKGRIHVSQRYIEALGYLIPGYFFNALIRKVPIVSYLYHLWFKESGILGTKFFLSGPIKKPSITINPFDSIIPKFLSDLMEISKQPTGNVTHRKKKKGFDQKKCPSIH